MRYLFLLLTFFAVFFQACSPIKKVSVQVAKTKINSNIKQDQSELSYNPSKTKVFDLLHTDLKVKPKWENQSLEGTAKLLLKPYFYSSNKLVLDAK